MKPEKNNYSGFPMILILYLILFPIPSLFGETYQFERMWPALKHPWYFHGPSDVVADSDGFVYVADSENDRIQKFTSDGEFVTRWGRKGSEDGDFDFPCGVAVDRDGFVYVTDVQNNRVQKFTSDGQFVTKWGDSGGEALNHPCGIATSDEGYVYVADTENHTIKKFAEDGKFVAKWGCAGRGDGEFYWPYGIDVDRGGFVYVTDSQNNRVQKFGPDGEFVTKWGRSGNGNGEFDWPDGLVLDGDGFVYVTDSMNNRVQKFTTDGQFVSQWGNYGNGDGEFSLPGGMACRNGFIYVADSENNRIQKFAEDGRFVTRWGKGNADGELNSPDGIAIDRDGNVYVADTDNYRIQKFDKHGAFITKWGREGDGAGEFVWPTRITVGRDGVYVTDTGHDRIERFAEDGEFVARLGTSGNGDGAFKYPYETAMDNHGFLYVADMGNDRIQKFNPEGEFVLKWGSEGSDPGEFRAPYGIAVSGGFVYVADTGNDRIQKFNGENGQFVTAWGKEGEAYGEFKDPYSITVDNEGFVYVVDWGNHRIQKFTSDGKFVTAWGEKGSYPGQMIYPGAGAVGPDGRYYIADNHNHRIQAFQRDTSEFTNKAIILAGGGPYKGNHLWDATRMCANFAYRALTYQGFTKKTIFYLSADTHLDLDNNGEPDDVDAIPTATHLRQALTQWAEDASTLVIYLVDHGGEGKFRMSETETLSAADLNSWLDSYQETSSGKVIFVYDACGSGSFLPPLASPGGGDRIVIASASPHENAHFVSSGTLSFSNFFWSDIFNGDTVGKAFWGAMEAVTHVTEFQMPLLDGDSDGEGNTPDDLEAARDVVIGNSADMRWDAPEIGDMHVDHVSDSENAAALYAEVTDKDGIARVWAVIIPADPHRNLSGNPVLELPTLELRSDEDGRYKAEYDESGMKETYRVAVYAKDRIGNTSEPKLVRVSPQNPARRRAVIVVGDSRSATFRSVTERNGASAYNALTFQWYSDDDIYFMSPDPSSEGWDSLPKLSNLREVIEREASQNTSDLVIHFVGHGQDGAIRLNDTETLAMADLDAWLDNLQGKIPGKVTVICDTDHSGSFLPLLTPPEGRKRILISGTSADQPALFLSQGDISFSRFFWDSVSDGMNVRDAFLNAGNAMGFLSGSHPDKTPQLDDNGNGVGNERSDGQSAMHHTIGMGIRSDNNDPIVGSASLSAKVLTGGEMSARILVENVTTTADTMGRVWAVVTPPEHLSDQHSGSDDLPVFDLIRTGENRYEGVYTNFSTFGTYRMDIYAMDMDGNVSLSKETRVHQSAGPDIYEPDDSPEQAGLIVMNDATPQHHNFYEPGDEDWVKFNGLSGASYTLKVSCPGANCDPVIELHDGDGNFLARHDTPLDSDADGIWDWPCDQDGIYHVRLVPADSGSFGEGTAYSLSMHQPIGPFTGWIKGSVTDAISGRPVERARIRTDVNSSCISRPNGRYLIIHEPGTFRMTVEAPDHKPGNCPDVMVSEGGTTIRNFALEPVAEPNPPSDGNSQTGSSLPPLPSDDVERASCFISATAHPHDSSARRLTSPPEESESALGASGCQTPARSSHNDPKTCHSADHSPSDCKIGLSELLRVIQMYNDGAYHCDPGGEDGYAPGKGDETCTPHDSDYRPQDWRISLNELLRLVQLYNAGGYHVDLVGEDRFAPVKQLGLIFSEERNRVSSIL